jgi:hypothetical protein
MMDQVIAGLPGVPANGRGSHRRASPLRAPTALIDAQVKAVLLEGEHLLHPQLQRVGDQSSS